MKKIVLFLFLFICISLGGVFGFLWFKNNSLEKKISDIKKKSAEIIEKSKTEESEINSKKQSLQDEKDQYADLYKEYELWQKMNQNVLDHM